MERTNRPPHLVQVDKRVFAELTAGRRFDVHEGLSFEVGDIYVAEEYDRAQGVLTGVLAVFRISWVARAGDADSPLSGLVASGASVLGLEPATFDIQRVQARREQPIAGKGSRAGESRPAPPVGDVGRLGQQPFPLATDDTLEDIPTWAAPVNVFVEMPCTPGELRQLEQVAAGQKISLATYMRACVFGARAPLDSVVMVGEDRVRSAVRFDGARASPKGATAPPPRLPLSMAG